MNNLYYIILGFLIVCDNQYRQYILSHIRPEYLLDECMREIFLAVKALIAEERLIDILTVRESIITDRDPKLLAKRLKVFRKYFVDKGLLEESCSDASVIQQIGVLLVDITNGVNYSIPVETAVKSFILDYVSNAKKELIAKYQRLLVDNPAGQYTNELTQKMKELDMLLTSDSWRQYIIDPDQIETEPDEEAVIFRKGQGFLWAGNIYLVSGYAGAMKSFFCLCLAASGVNHGYRADNTLSFHSVAKTLKVLFADTELAKNTVRKRIKALKNMTGGKLNKSTFNYLSLRQVPGGIDAKLSVLDEACHCFHPDIIVVDSGRDLCHDYNDNCEADQLVNHFKQLANDLNAVLISTSHKSLGNGNPKGHFGMRMNEACGLEMSLTKVTDGINTYIKVELPKQREDVYESFSFTLNQETGLLIEFAPTVDRSEERKQYDMAKNTITTVLRPGDAVRYNDLKRKIMKAFTSISERTAKNYIGVLVGTVLVKNPDGLYQLSDTETELPFDDDLPSD